MQLSSAQAGWAFASLGAIVAAVVACNGTTSDTGIGFGFASTDGGIGFSGPEGPGSASVPPSGSAPFPGVTCPQTPPIEGDPCFDGTCEYGTAVDPACNIIARCDPATRAWALEQPTHCPTTCPSHFDERVPGASCGDTDVCTYLEATCGCAGAIDGAWTSISGGSNNVGDAGDEASTTGDGGGDGGPAAIGQWQCVRPGNGCPARRPLEGTHCSKPMDCDYGTCVFGVPLSMTCVNDRWTALFVGSCP